MNVLVYVVDALRADHLSCYGYDRETTPAIDSLAADGVRYARCFSPATWTKPVAASLLSGVSPPTHRTRTRSDLFDSPAVEALPERLAARGYATGAVSAMGNVSTATGFDRGFDEFVDLYREPGVVERRATTTGADEELDHESASTIALPRAADVNEYLLDWLDSVDGPFFAFCWAIDPHVPYDPPPEHRTYTDPDYDGAVDGSRDCLPAVDDGADRRQLEALYDGEIAYTDARLGDLVERLRASGAYEDTMVVVVGDHGEAFGEHGRLTHGHHPYDELLHVPLVVKPPGGADGVVVEEVTSLVDVLPTVLAAVDGELPSDSFDGRPLPPFGPAGTSAPVFSETQLRDAYPRFSSVRTERWKFIRVDSPGTIRGAAALLQNRIDAGTLLDLVRHPLFYLRRYSSGDPVRLYDLSADPGEHENVADDHPEEARRFEDRLDSWLDGHDDAPRSGTVDEETERQLQKLGYVD